MRKIKKGILTGIILAGVISSTTVISAASDYAHHSDTINGNQVIAHSSISVYTATAYTYYDTQTNMQTNSKYICVRASDGDTFTDETKKGGYTDQQTNKFEALEGYKSLSMTTYHKITNQGVNWSYTTYVER